MIEKTIKKIQNSSFLSVSNKYKIYFTVNRNVAIYLAMKGMYTK